MFKYLQDMEKEVSIHFDKIVDAEGSEEQLCNKEAAIRSS